MPAKLKIPNEIIKQEGDELIKFITCSFQIVLENTLIEDELDNCLCYVISDSRISDDVKTISITISTDKTPDYVPLNNRLGFYKHKYYAWFEDGKIPYPEPEENHTIQQLEKSIDFQLDEYIKHKNNGDDLLAILTTGFIRKMSDRIEKLKKNK